MSKFCCPVGRYADADFLIVHVIQLRPVQLKVVEFVLHVVQLILVVPVGNGGYFRVPVDFALQELGDVKDEAEEEDGQDVEPGLPVVGGKVEWIADAQEPLYRDRHRHEDRCVHCDACEGENDGHGEGEGLIVGLKGSECVLEASERDVEDVKGGEGKQELVETVSKFWPGQYNDGNEVPDEAKTANDADEEAIAVVLEVDHGGVVGEVRATVSGQSSTDIKCPIEHVMLTSPPTGFDQNCHISGFIINI